MTAFVPTLAPGGTSSGRRRGVVGSFVSLFTILFLMLMGRFFYLQILRGEDFKEQARISFIATERLPARRGRVLDREGRVLADNVPAYELRLTPHYVSDPEVLERVVGQLTDLVELTVGEAEALTDAVVANLDADERWDAIVVRRELVGERCPHDGEPMALLSEPVRRLMDPVTGEFFDPIDPKATYSPHGGDKLAWHDDGDAGLGRWASCKGCARTYVTRPLSPVTGSLLRVVVQNLQCRSSGLTYSNQVAAVQSALHGLPGVELRTSFRRRYPFGYEMAHTLGYVKPVNREDLDANPGVYGLNDSIGRSGVERALEADLRGEPGESLYIKDRRGRVADRTELQGLMGDVDFTPATPGQDVWLTLDVELQAEVRKAFRYYKSGGAAVIDPRTGELLALYSKPGFDPNVWSGRLPKSVWEATTSNPYTPLLHKAVTAYAPGSVYKIVTASAALSEGLVDPEMTIHCPGHYDYQSRRFHCHNRSGHGPVDVIEALKHSCDVYFYRVGQMLGMDTLAEYGRRFGYGEKAGLESFERPGRVPTKGWYADHYHLGWQPGFTLSVAIGQGALTASTVQVARSFAALLNGGDVLRVGLVKKRVDGSGQVTQRFIPEVVRKLDLEPDVMAVVREGLVRVVNDPDGTASNVALEEMVFAGKTGTAEAAERRDGADADLARWLKEDHAWFAGYAPADDPQVVVVVFVEHAGSGSKMAAPIAQRIVKSWRRLGFYERPEVEGPLGEPAFGPGNDPLDPDPDAPGGGRP